MEESSKRYNGWGNYETWLVALWLNNDQSTYSYWQEAAERFQENASECQQVQSGVWTIDEAAKFTLGDALRSEIEEGNPIEEVCLYGDLLQAALSEVNWYEIAESYLAE